MAMHLKQSFKSIAPFGGNRLPLSFAKQNKVLQRQNLRRQCKTKFFNMCSAQPPFWFFFSLQKKLAAEK